MAQQDSNHKECKHCGPDGFSIQLDFNAADVYNRSMDGYDTNLVDECCDDPYELMQRLTLYPIQEVKPCMNTFFEEYLREFTENVVGDEDSVIVATSVSEVIVVTDEDHDDYEHVAETDVTNVSRRQHWYVYEGVIEISDDDEDAYVDIDDSTVATPAPRYDGVFRIPDVPQLSSKKASERQTSLNAAQRLKFHNQKFGQCSSNHVPLNTQQPQSKESARAIPYSEIKKCRLYFRRLAEARKEQQQDKDTKKTKDQEHQDDKDKNPELSKRQKRGLEKEKCFI